MPVDFIPLKKSTDDRPETPLTGIPGRIGILTCMAGEGRFILNGESQIVDEGRCLLIDKDSRLSIRFMQSGAQPLLLFFQSDLVANALIRQQAELCWLERVHLIPPLLRERLFWLNRLGNNCSSFSAMKADAMIGDILRDLIHDARAAGAEAERLSVSRKSTRIQLYQRLALAREWIDANYASPLSLGTIAGQATLNSQHFLRMFRDCFGLTPHQYLTGIRLEFARQLLAGTTQPVSAICRLTGFESPSSFSGLFRQRYGASPRTYRQNLAQPSA